jgi:hypothetical protein
MPPLGGDSIFLLLGCCRGLSSPTKRAKPSGLAALCSLAGPPVLEPRPVRRAACAVARAAPGADRFTGRRSGEFLHEKPPLLLFIKLEQDRRDFFGL